MLDGTVVINGFELGAVADTIPAIREFAKEFISGKAATKAKVTGVAGTVGAANGQSPARRAAPANGKAAASGRAATPAKREKLSKDAYRRGLAQVEGELTRLGLRKSHLELEMGDPRTSSNYVELRRITSELADLERALAAAEEAWLELEERAP